MVVRPCPNGFPRVWAGCGCNGGRRVFIAEGQLEGAEKANEVVSKETIDNFNAIFRNILKAWNLIPLLSPDNIGILHDEVAKICNNIDKKYDKNGLFRALRYLVKVPHHIEEGLRFNLDNKLKRSFKNYEKADHFCDCVLKEFSKTKDTIDKELLSIFPLFEFIEYSCLITKTIKEDSYNVSKYKENQVERFINLTGHFKKFSTDIVSLDNKNKNLNKELNKMSTLAMKVANMCEEKAQEIETDNEQIFVKPMGNKVFIIHGHNTEILKELKKNLEKSGIEPIVLSEKPDDGKTVIEKFEHYARYSSFAFVIMTKDDFVENNAEPEPYYQGRPNVLLELGWFYGRYGRDRVMILKEKGVKMPSDLNGIITHDLSEGMEKIKEDIRKNLEHIGIEIVINGE